MDWKHFFRLMVMKNDPSGIHPYFQFNLKVPNQFAMEDLLISKFENWHLTEIEKKRFSLSLRKIIHCHHYFKSLEFDRISSNFIERLSSEKESELHFSTQGGGVYLFLAILKAQPLALLKKTIICETSELPIPIIKLPLESKINLQFHYHPQNHSFLTGFPSLWAHPEVLELFDPKSFKSKVA